MLNTIGKVYEGILVNKVENYLCNNNKLNEIQYGFTKKRNTIQAIQNIINKIQSAKHEGKYTVLITLDIDAVDNAWWPQVLHEINTLNIPQNLYKTIENYLKDRKVELNYVKEKITQAVEKGTPQGSKLAPLLCKILINDIIQLENDDIKIITFADDIAVIIKTNTYKGLKAKTNDFLIKINKWANNKKLTFNISKTDIIFFGIYQNQAKPIFKFNNAYIHCKNELKYLGIIITDNLKWNAHINKIVEKARKITFQLRTAVKEEYGLDKHAMQIIFNAAIRPAITYGAEIWGGNLNVKQRQKINSAQRTALIGITRAYKTVLTEALQAIGNSYPLDLYVEVIHGIRTTNE